MWVKICGTTDLADAQLAVAAGADALGFIFAPSKRRISVEQAAAITAELPPRIERVGVFAEASAEEIADTVTGAALTAVQLHRPHDPEQTRELCDLLGPEVKLIQVVGVPAASDAMPASASASSVTARLIDEMRRALNDPLLWAVLLDSVKDGNSGGLGIAFPWLHTRQVIDQALPSPVLSTEEPFAQNQARTPRIVLAGGLHAGNVAEAIRLLDPWGVDCVSGVEAAPGQKDPGRLASFLHAARSIH